ncbi:MAG TPA: hypothetical protein VGJ28_07815 [Micromonosporaceae bacterium]
MPNLEEELKAVLNGYAGQGAPTGDRRGAVGQRIKHHQRVRATGVALAVLLVLLVAGGVTVFESGHRSVVAPTKSPSPTAPPTGDWQSLTTAAPGHLPAYAPSIAQGGRQVAAKTITMPATRTIRLTYTPTSTTFFLGMNCYGSGSLAGILTVNGHEMSADGCTTTAVTSGSILPIQPNSGTPWSHYGVHVGKPTTIVATFGLSSTNSNQKLSLKPSNLPATATVAVYLPVPWTDYPHGPIVQPKPTLAHARTLATFTDQTTTVHITLPKHLQVSIVKDGYGPVQVDGLDAYVGEALGTNNTENAAFLSRVYTFPADFVGQKVSLSAFSFVQPSGASWSIIIYGSD